MKQTIKKAKVSLDLNELDANGLTTFADGTATGLTGNINFPNPPVSIVNVTSQATALRSTLKLIASGNKSTTLTKQAAQQANTLILSLTANGHYVEDTANLIAAGDITRAEGLITGTGYKLKKKIAPHPRDFEVVATGPGWAHIRAKKAGAKKQEGHLWRYGVVTAKGVPPVTVILRVTLETDIILNDLASGTIIGVQHASILPVSHTKKTDVTPTITGRVASLVPISKSRHPMFSHTVSDPYQWTDFIYTVIP